MNIQSTYKKSEKRTSKINITRIGLPTYKQWVAMGPGNSKNAGLRLYDNLYFVDPHTNQHKKNQIYVSGKDETALQTLAKKRNYTVSIRPVIEFDNTDELPNKSFIFRLNGLQFYSYAIGRAICMTDIGNVAVFLSDFNAKVKEEIFTDCQTEMMRFIGGNIPDEYTIEYHIGVDTNLSINLTDIGLPKASVVTQTMTADEISRYKTPIICRDASEYQYYNGNNATYLSAAGYKISYIPNEKHTAIIPFIEFEVINSKKEFVKGNFIYIRGVSFRILTTSGNKYQAMANFPIALVATPATYYSQDNKNLPERGAKYVREFLNKILYCERCEIPIQNVTTTKPANNLLPTSNKN